MAEIILMTGNVLPLSQRLDMARPDTLKVEAPAQTITFTQSVGFTSNHHYLTDNVSFVQAVQVSGRHYRVGNTINFQDRAVRVKELHLGNLLVLTQRAGTANWQDASNNFSLVQSVVVSRGFSQTITFTDQVTFLISRVFDIADTLTLTQGVTIYKQNDPNFALGQTVAPINHTPVTLSGHGYSITLNIPEFGDEYEIEHQRINRQTRGGDRIIFKDPIWPVIERTSLKFNGLSQSKIHELMTFMYNTMGKTISLVDHNGITWNVMITNPDAEAEQSSGQACGGFDIQLEFEGSRV